MRICRQHRPTDARRMCLGVGCEAVTLARPVEQALQRLLSGNDNMDDWTLLVTWLNNCQTLKRDLLEEA